MTRQGQAGTEAFQALYPFLYAGPADLSAVLEEVRQSTVAKAREITELRRVVGARDSGRFMAWFTLWKTSRGDA